MKATVLLFLSLIAGVLSGLAFQGNVTLSNQGDFKFRLNDFTQFSLIGIYNGAFLASLSVDANPQSATVDGLYGAAYAGISAPPSAYVSFFSSSSQWTFGGNNYAAANTSNAAAFIGKVFVSLDEVDANGNVVQTILLKSLIWTTSDANTGKGGLRYVTFKGVPISLTSNFVVLVTYVTSDVVGVLNVVGTAIVTPKSFESIIEIDNFPYQNTANSIRLNIVTASATASVVAQGAVTHLVSGNGNNGAYFTLDNKAAVNGQAAPVSISAFVTGSGTVTYGNADLDLQVRLKYGAAATFKLVSVTFPAGAVKIVYDPAIGAGANPPASPADRTVPFFIALFIAMLLLL